MQRSLNALVMMCVVLLGTTAVAVRVFPSPGVKPPAHYDYCQANLEQDSLSAHLRNSTGEGYELVQVQVLFRHGDRTPLGQIRKTPTYEDHNVWQCWADELNNYALEQPVGHIASELEIPRIFAKVYETGKEPLRGNCGLGELTPKGVSQHNQLGAMFRELYVDQMGFLPEQLNTADVFIRAGDEERLLHSAQAQLRGLYPPAAAAQSQVVQMVVRDSEWDNMTPNTNGCPELAQLKKEAQKSSAYKQHADQGNQVDAMLKQQFQVSGLNKFDVVDLIRGQRCHNLTGFSVLNAEQTEQVIDWEDVDFCWFPFDQASYRIGIGSFIGDMWQKALDAMNNENPFKWVMWSGHDSSLVPVLRAMGIFDGYWPPYASHLVWELWRKNGDYYVYLHYNGATLTTPTCSAAMCPVKEFAAGISPIIPTDIYSECVNRTQAQVFSSTSLPGWKFNF